MEYIVNYWSLDGDNEHIIYCESKEEAEQKAKEIDTDKYDDIEIISREEYDNLELEIIEG